MFKSGKCSLKAENSVIQLRRIITISIAVELLNSVASTRRYRCPRSRRPAFVISELTKLVYLVVVSL